MTDPAVYGDEDLARRRAQLDAAATAFVELVGAVGPGSWDAPGLGEWTVRQLVGHAARALLTVRDFLGSPAAPGAPVIDGVRGYYAWARTVDPAEVARRGREAGAALGDDPAGAVGAVCSDALAALGSAGPADTVTLGSGAVMALVPYLETRVFELAVHCLDLAAALGVDAPASLAPAVSAALEMAGRVAAGRPDAAAFLLALTGRRPLETSVV